MASWKPTGHTDEVLRQRDRMWGRDLEENLRAIRSGRLAARMAEAMTTPELRESARTAAIMSAALPRGELTARLRVLGVDGMWSRADLRQLSQGSVVLQVGGLCRLLTGPGVARNVSHAFPEARVLWLSATSLDAPPSDACYLGVRLDGGISTSGSFPSEWNLGNLSQTCSVSSAWAHYASRGGAGYGYGDFTIVDVSGGTMTHPVNSSAVNDDALTWGVVPGLTWVENQAGRVVSAGQVDVSAPDLSYGTVKVKGWKLAITYTEC